MDKIM